MTKNEKINLAADIAVDLINEVIRTLSLKRVEKRLDKQIQGLRAENAELKSRIAKLEQKSGIAADTPYVGTSYSDQEAKAMFRIHASDGMHVGQINMLGRDFVNDARELDQAVSHAYDLIKRNFKDASYINIASDKTGAKYQVSYDRKTWPKSNVTIITPQGKHENMGCATVSNAGKFILDRDRSFPGGCDYDVPKGMDKL